MYDNITRHDTTPYFWAQDISFVTSELQRCTKTNFDWCRYNPLKARSSLLNLFCKKGILKNFVPLFQSLLFDKVAGLKPATLLKKRLCHRRFPVKNV